MSDVQSINNETQNSILTRNELDQIIVKAKEDLDLLTEEDINNIIDIAEIPDNHYLENQTTDYILTDIYNVIIDNHIPNYEDIIKKLTNYRYVDEINEIFKGRNIKYINKNTNKFNNGGLVIDIKFLENGTHILCKGFNNYIKQIKFDDSIIFQMLTTEEQIILMSNSVIL